MSTLEYFNNQCSYLLKGTMTPLERKHIIKACVSENDLLRIFKITEIKSIEVTPLLSSVPYRSKSPWAQ